MGSAEKAAQLEKVPAFRRLFPGELPFNQLTAILEEAKIQLDETRQLLVA
jgi:hypothetical protein